MQITEPPGDEQGLELSTPAITSSTAPYDLVRKMRASILVLGPLWRAPARRRLAARRLRHRAAAGRPAHQGPGGARRARSSCARLHPRHGAERPARRQVRLALPSVGATENLLMAASLADGETVIANAAREPEVVDLAALPVAMGARIEGIGQRHAAVQGVPRAARRRARHRARPHRARHLRHRRGDHRRRARADRRPRRADHTPSPRSSRRPASTLQPTERGVRGPEHGAGPTASTS